MELKKIVLLAGECVDTGIPNVKIGVGEGGCSAGAEGGRVVKKSWVVADWAFIEPN